MERNMWGKKKKNIALWVSKVTQHFSEISHFRRSGLGECLFSNRLLMAEFTLNQKLAPTFLDFLRVFFAPMTASSSAASLATDPRSQLLAFARLLLKPRSDGGRRPRSQATWLPKCR